ncbi:MAG: ribosome recycling factor, partial [Oscillospiraceae bacterium]|nr:ribosome recycling factor [Oscillospiraceae bacterium]
MDDRIKVFSEKMDKSYSNMLEEFSTIRAGRANPKILSKITVDYYGSPTPLQQVGNITVPEARIIQIQPWESSMLKQIECAINMSDIGINPTNDGKVIRLVFPELTEERRKDLA